MSVHAFPFNWRFLYMNTLNFGLCTSVSKGYCPTVIHNKGWLQFHVIDVRRSWIWSGSTSNRSYSGCERTYRFCTACSDFLKSCRVWWVVNMELISSAWVTVSVTFVRACVMNDTETCMLFHDTSWGHPIVLCYKIHNICSYSQTQLSVMSLIKSTHLATGFDQTWSSSGHIYIYAKIKAVHGLRCKCRS